MMIICHYKLWHSWQPLSLHLTFITHGLNLDPDWATTFIKMQHENHDQTTSTQTPPSLRMNTHTHTHTGTQNVQVCFIMTSLCIVHLTNTQSLIFPLNTSLSRWLHPVLGRKGHTIKWLRPSVHVIEWWCITPGWLYVYLTHCEHEYDFRDH